MRYDKKTIEKLTGARVNFEKITDSTNNDAKAALLNGAAKNGEIFAAEGQTKGRGRLDKSFFSPKGTGLYFSAVITDGIYNPTDITVKAAVSVCDAAKEIFGVNCGIKWVNDIYLDGRKCAGILCEAVSDKDTIKGVVVGIGVNVYQPEDGFPDDISVRAGAIAGKKHSDKRAELLAAIYNNLFFDADAGNLVEKYRFKSVLDGKRVVITDALQSYEATALYVDGDCRLNVRLDDGSVEKLKYGDVRIAVI